MDDDRDMSKAAAATTQSVPTTTVRGARVDWRFATRVRLVPDAEGLDLLVRSRRPDDFTRSTNVRNVGRRAVRILLPLFEGTTIPSSYVLVNGSFRSKGIAVAGMRRAPRNH